MSEPANFESLYCWVISDPRSLPPDVCQDMERLRALAAFTPEDVRLLRDWRAGAIGPNHAEWSAWLIARLAALLPP